MAIRKRWWQKKPERFAPQISEALASGDPTRVGLAWAIILVTGGDRGAGPMAEFARGIGREQNVITMGLQGKSFGARQQARVFAAFPDRDLPDTIFSNRHPFSIGSGFSDSEPLEPGDPDWVSFWNLVAGDRHGLASAEELRKKHPNAFPDVT